MNQSKFTTEKLAKMAMMTAVSVVLLLIVQLFSKAANRLLTEKD